MCNVFTDSSQCVLDFGVFQVKVEVNPSKTIYGYCTSLNIQLVTVLVLTLSCDNSVSDLLANGCIMQHFRRSGYGNIT